MAEFGWAYLSGAVRGVGDAGSIQWLASTNGPLTGSDKLVWDKATDRLVVTGSVYVSGSIYARQLTTIHEDKIISKIHATGSTWLGNSSDDRHLMTGSFTLKGNMQVSGAVSLKYQHDASATVTVSSTTSFVGIGNTTSTTVNLPACSGLNPGQIVIIKDEANVTRVDPGNLITINPNGSDTIDYAAEYKIAGDFVALSLYTNGDTKWFIY